MAATLTQEQGGNRQKSGTAQQHHICFVIGRFAYWSMANRPLSRICGTAAQFRFLIYFSFLLSYKKVFIFMPGW
jgi:hypothetical protein